jgi:hypothetical protein
MECMDEKDRMLMAAVKSGAVFPGENKMVIL